ncbi:MAG: RNA polymerase sigma factor [Planctomycetota bacterium]
MAHTHPSDEELEARWKQGSTPAFSLLFERYYARVFAFSYRITHDRHAAEDLAQRAFLNLYKKPPGGEGRGSTFKSLVFTVVRNESVNHIKWRARRREGAIEGAAGTPTDAPPPDVRLDGKERGQELGAALERLPQEEREIVTLRVIEGLTFREVCEVTGLSRDAVRWRLAKGLETLRMGLIPQSGGES